MLRYITPYFTGLLQKYFSYFYTTLRSLDILSCLSDKDGFFSYVRVLGLICFLSRQLMKWDSANSLYQAHCLRTFFFS